MFPIAYLDGANKLAKAQGFGLVTHTGTNEVRFKVNGQSTYAPAAQYYEKTWNAPSYTPKYDCTTSRNPVRVPLNYISGDFNVDGLTDIIGIANPYSYETCYPILPRPGESCGDCCRCETTNVPDSKVYFINLDRRISTGFTNRAGTLETALQSDHRLLTADFNGDGKTDILHVTSGKIDVYTLNSANGLVRLWSTTDSRIRTDYPLYLGDYNGDGKTDFMMPTANNSATFALFLSTGVQFSLKIQVYPFTYKQYSIATSPINSYDLIPTDINGDGRTDILEYKTTTHNGGANGSQTVGMYYNTFSTVSEVTPAFSFIKSATKTGTLNHLPIPVFLSPADRSNNNLDFVTISNNTLCNFTFGKDNREDMLLRSISNKGTTHNN